MLLIILGIVLILAGGGSIVWGTMQNNDIEAQFTSFMKSGELDPGDLFILIGGFAVVLGIVLLVIGIVLRTKKAPAKAVMPATPTVVPVVPPVAAVAEAEPVKPEEKPAVSGVCPVCAAPLDAGSKFCGNCGTAVNPCQEAGTDDSALPEITQTVEDVMKEAAEPAPTPHCCPHFAGHNADGSSKCQYCCKANPPVPTVTQETCKVTEPLPAATAVKPVYHAAPKGDRKAICPHCGARQVEATHCKYCGTRLS